VKLSLVLATPGRLKAGKYGEVVYGASVMGVSSILTLAIILKYR
jgi:hypothetical protein